MMKISQILDKSQEIDLHQEIVNWKLSYEDLVREEREMLVLLYEFPAETRLTVYRRLDIIEQGYSQWGVPRQAGSSSLGE